MPRRAGWMQWRAKIMLREPGLGWKRTGSTGADEEEDGL